MISINDIQDMYKEYNTRMDVLNVMRHNGEFGILELLESTSRVISGTLEVINKSVADEIRCGNNE